MFSTGWDNGPKPQRNLIEKNKWQNLRRKRLERWGVGASD